MELKELFFSSNEKELLKSNRESVNGFLRSVMRIVTVILGIFMAVMAAVSFKFDYAYSYKKVYLAFFFLDALLFAASVFCKRCSEKHPLLLVYTFFVLYLCFAYAANFSNKESQVYVSIIVALFMIPLLLFDKTWRVNAFVLAGMAAGLFLSYKFKPKPVFSSDTVNIVVYTIAGIMLGKSFRLNRLKAFEAERVLTVERNTDSLTQLANRRKLFEHLRLGNESLLLRPTGMFMIDIDHFKQFNDHYGHRAGDACLGAIGRCFSEFEKTHRYKFFRYGGEEFCALCWSKNYMELAADAELLLQNVRDLQVPFNIEENQSGVVTISLGYAAFDRNAMDYDFESMIKITDAALYSAKSHGRNCARGA